MSKTLMALRRIVVYTSTGILTVALMQGLICLHTRERRLGQHAP